jgi:hypothetical protein
MYKFFIVIKNNNVRPISPKNNSIGSVHKIRTQFFNNFDSPLPLCNAKTVQIPKDRNKSLITPPPFAYLFCAHSHRVLIEFSYPSRNSIATHWHCSQQKSLFDFDLCTVRLLDLTMFGPETRGLYNCTSGNPKNFNE